MFGSARNFPKTYEPPIKLPYKKKEFFVSFRKRVCFSRSKFRLD